MAIAIERSWIPADRYKFDCGQCSYANGYAQIDTRQDASYFGTWCSPSERKIVCYAEGDVTVQTADTDEEFVEAVRELARWNEERGWGMKIDALATPRLAEAFRALGLGDLLTLKGDS